MLHLSHRLNCPFSGPAGAFAGIGYRCKRQIGHLFLVDPLVDHIFFDSEICANFICRQPSILHGYQTRTETPIFLRISKHFHSIGDDIILCLDQKSRHTVFHLIYKVGWIEIDRSDEAYMSIDGFMRPKDLYTVVEMVLAPLYRGWLPRGLIFRISMKLKKRHVIVLRLSPRQRQSESV